uniref:Uncharacterized protein n=1 Tax=Percolomonas cosmopolitus TaxID=63605 RepID=A0A7S1PDX8_9EUKA|mmetsp:Transcript_10433/g.38765  ORF Transcript_10433/g.38765 Transcript_10433/m.38765 type:complete len:717 (+) Transcript_10433:10797-12947(+)
MFSLPFTRSFYTKCQNRVNDSKKCQNHTLLASSLENSSPSDSSLSQVPLNIACMTVSDVYFEYLERLSTSRTTLPPTEPSKDHPGEEILWCDSGALNKGILLSQRLRHLVRLIRNEWRDHIFMQGIEHISGINDGEGPPQSLKMSTLELFTHIATEYQNHSATIRRSKPVNIPHLKRDKHRAAQLYMDFVHNLDDELLLTEKQQFTLDALASKSKKANKGTSLYLAVDAIGDTHSHFNQAMRKESTEEWDVAVKMYVDIVTRRDGHNSDEQWVSAAKLQLMRLLNRAQSCDIVQKALNSQVPHELILKWIHELATQGNLHANLQLAQYFKSLNRDEFAAAWIEQSIHHIRDKHAAHLINKHQKSIEHSIAELRLDSRPNLFEYHSNHIVGTEQATGRASFHCALMKEHGIHTEKNLKMAREFYETATQQGHPKSPIQLAILLSNSDNDKSIRNVPKAIKILKQQIEKGNNLGRFLLANIYDEGYVEEKPELRENSRQGEQEYVLGNLMYTMESLATMDEVWLDARILLAALHLMDSVEYPSILSYDYGVSMVKSLADQDMLPTAQYLMGLIFFDNGSLNEGMEYLKRVCTMLHQESEPNLPAPQEFVIKDAQYLLGQACKVLNQTQDSEHHFSIALSLKHAASAYELGQIHMTKDVQLAEHYLKLAYSQNVHQASISLASIAFYRRDWAQCREWCQKATGHLPEQAKSILRLLPSE